MENVFVYSEWGRLKKVLIHTPGAEVEKMTPDNAQRALYSDILNLDIAREEFEQFKGVLNAFCSVFEVRDVLLDILENKEYAEYLIKKVCAAHNDPKLFVLLNSLSPCELSRQLIEGVELVNDSLSHYLSEERYRLKPLHNFFFTRDASMSVYQHILIGQMANKVREREAIIMEAVFRFHPQLRNPIMDNDPSLAYASGKMKIEGGDLLVASENVLVVGIGVRTSTQGIDYLIEWFKLHPKPVQHILVQELPESPESFIHLDMVFTFLDQETCMVYEPLILGHNQYRTIHIQIKNGSVARISNESDLISALKKTGIKVKPLLCGGTDRWNQDREQWHSGANFFALAPGVVLGYERNKHTLDELSGNGFNIIGACDLLKQDRIFPKSKTVITLKGSELARGGGGARCMSMPVERELD
jgi:arginine deiminase